MDFCILLPMIKNASLQAVGAAILYLAICPANAEPSRNYLISQCDKSERHASIQTRELQDDESPPKNSISAQSVPHYTDKSAPLILCELNGKNIGIKVGENPDHPRNDNVTVSIGKNDLFDRLWFNSSDRLDITSGTGSAPLKILLCHEDQPCKEIN
jgi:hypothetical protein